MLVVFKSVGGLRPKVPKAHSSAAVKSTCKNRIVFSNS